MKCFRDTSIGPIAIFLDEAIFLEGYLAEDTVLEDMCYRIAPLAKIRVCLDFMVISSTINLLLSLPFCLTMDKYDVQKRYVLFARCGFT